MGRMNGAAPASDVIDQAIATAEPVLQLVGLQVRMSSGRPAILQVPVDLSAQEAIDLLGYIAVQLPGKLAEARSPAARILVPSGLVGHG
jgi:hypothetical protein